MKEITDECTCSQLWSTSQSFEVPDSVLCVDSKLQPAPCDMYRERSAMARRRSLQAASRSEADDIALGPALGPAGIEFFQRRYVAVHLAVKSRMMCYSRTLSARDTSKSNEVFYMRTFCFWAMS